MAKVVSVQSSNKYAGQNPIFAMFCYKSAELRDDLLEQWFVDKLRTITNENAKKKYTKSCCMNMSPEDNDCPFILSNPMFSHFSNFEPWHIGYLWKALVLSKMILALY